MTTWCRQAEEVQFATGALADVLWSPKTLWASKTAKMIALWLLEYWPALAGTQYAMYQTACKPADDCPLYTTLGRLAAGTSEH